MLKTRRLNPEYAVYLWTNSTYTGFQQANNNIVLIYFLYKMGFFVIPIVHGPLIAGFLFFNKGEDNIFCPDFLVQNCSLAKYL
jgi:hypothetical protein